MPKFNVTLAFDVSVYGHAEVEADTIEDAIEILRKDAEGRNMNTLESGSGAFSNVSRVEWEAEQEHRIVSISDEADKPLIDDIELTHMDEPYKVLQHDELFEGLGKRLHPQEAA